jgi:3-hydroxyacyl-CoA dehydrogenase
MDAALKYRLGLPMGTFELMDFTGAVETRTRGLKSVDDIMKTHPDFEPWPALLAAMRYLVTELWGVMTERGLTGIKVGRGFYTYPEGKYAKPEIRPELAERLEPIQLLATIINTSAWCVTNGVGSIDDINKSCRLGFGWPKGVFEFVDEYGANKIASVLKSKAEKAPEQLHDFYKVDPLLANWKSR